MDYPSLNFGISVNVVVLRQDKRKLSVYLVKLLHLVMDIIRTIGLHADQLLPHQLLLSWLKDYRRPNAKILALKAQGFLEPLKKRACTLPDRSNFPLIGF